MVAIGPVGFDDGLAPVNRLLLIGGKAAATAHDRLPSLGNDPAAGGKAGTEGWGWGTWRSRAL
jgi:hypothetical protein